MVAIVLGGEQKIVNINRTDMVSAHIELINLSMAV